MIVSHSRKFIFLKPKKVGGTSVELALSNICGDEDVITPVNEEHLRQGRGPQNYIIPYRGLLWNLGFRREGASFPKIVFAAHSPGRDIKRHLGKDVWNEYRKVTIIRNPWDREVSRYFWERDRPKRPKDFETFIEEVTRRHPIGNDWLASGLGRDDGFLIRYEHLAEDYATFVRSLGVENVPALPKAKGETRPSESRRYQEVYNACTRDAVAQIYRKEIEAFGFAF